MVYWCLVFIGRSHIQSQKGLHTMMIEYLPFNFCAQPVVIPEEMDATEPDIAQVLEVFTSPDPDILSVIHIRRRARIDGDLRRDLFQFRASLLKRGVKIPAKIKLLFLELRYIRKRVLFFEHPLDVAPAT